MFKLDLDPLAPRLLQNREAHIYYLKHTQEQADILRGIVEQAKAKQPLDNALDLACKHVKRIQESLVYVRDTCPNAIKLSEKRFGNDQIARIIGYGDYQLGIVVISRVYYVEGLGHNLFSVGQFCDADLEVAFQKNTCFILRNVRTDNGTEFVNQTLREWYENVGITHQTSVARTPQQNGVVERRNRTLVEAA
ncbi:retrovirus-related pol polyprotein from transposon TNT 1-94 [Tanacetum coccineum]